MLLKQHWGSGCCLFLVHVWREEGNLSSGPSQPFSSEQVFLCFGKSPVMLGWVAVSSWYPFPVLGLQVHAFVCLNVENFYCRAGAKHCNGEGQARPSCSLMATRKLGRAGKGPGTRCPFKSPPHPQCSLVLTRPHLLRVYSAMNLSLE